MFQEINNIYQGYNDNIHKFTNYMYSQNCAFKRLPVTYRNSDSIFYSFYFSCFLAHSWRRKLLLLLHLLLINGVFHINLRCIPPPVREYLLIYPITTLSILILCVLTALMLGSSCHLSLSNFPTVILKY